MGDPSILSSVEWLICFCGKYTHNLHVHSVFCHVIGDDDWAKSLVPSSIVEYLEH